MEKQKSWVNKNHRYAVAARTEKEVTILESYETLEHLKEGYADWMQFASKRHLAKPLPIEYVKTEGQNRRCKVLTDLVISSSSP